MDKIVVNHLNCLPALPMGRPQGMDQCLWALRAIDSMHGPIGAIAAICPQYP